MGRPTKSGRSLEPVAEEIIRLYVEEDLSANEIAHRVGSTSHGVLALLRRKNVPTRRPGWRLPDQNRDLVGQRFDKLVVVNRNPVGLNRDRWVCKCDCGRTHVAMGWTLLYSSGLSCQECMRPRVGYGDVPGFVWTDIMRGARARKIPVTITVKDLHDQLQKQQWKCFYSGLPIGFATTVQRHKKNRETTASVDRMDSNLGYELGNVLWVHKDINIMKCDHQSGDFIKYCKAVAAHACDSDSSEIVSPGWGI
jgi:hypothetical protein